jgi:RNA polymerase sigma-70 factor (ECF subfamily)
LKKKQKYDDKSLLESVKNSDQNAFTILFNRYSGMIYQVSLKYTADRSAAEEIVQEVFTRVWINREQIKPDLAFVPYIIIIAKNLIINSAKKRLHEITYKKYKAYSNRLNNNFTQNQVYLKELEDRLKAFVCKMPSRRKEIFKLSREEGMTIKQISNHLGISESTIENQINKALKDLKEYLNKNN